MSVEHLAVGWRPGPFASVGACAGVLMATALAIHAGGIAAGLVVLACTGGVSIALRQQACVDGPSLMLRSARTLGRAVHTHAHAVTRLEYRRARGWPRLALRWTRDGLVLQAVGPRPGAEAFRQVALWMIVHAHRGAHVDPALLDALAGMADHARARATSHA